MRTLPKSAATASGGEVSSSVVRSMLATKPVQPVVVWAVIGAAFSALTLYVVVKWVTGPDFARVPVGPNQPPDWMKAVLMSSQLVFPALAVVTLYWLLVRPWQRHGRVTFDGLLCIALLIASVWDPLSAYLRGWFSYNSYFLNWGSPILQLPGAMSPRAPGVSVAWPAIAIPAMYVCIIPWAVILGSTIMRATKRRFPRLNGFGLAAVLFVIAVVFDLLLEGAILLPLGFWSYPGGWWPLLNGGHYYQLPFNDLLHAAVMWTALPAFRFFTNDKGETIAERGMSAINAGPLKHLAIRLLAVVGMVHVVLWGTYHIPNAFWGANAQTFPEDVTSRSYLTNQCGPRIDRACPGPHIPLSRPGSGYVNWEGNFVGPTPAGTSRSAEP